MPTMYVLLVLALFISSVAAQSGHPVFDPPTERIVLKERSSGKVECVAKGDRPLIYTWYNQKDAEITSNENQNVFIRRSENGTSLIFVKVNASHAGLYSCSATNKHGTASKPYDIIVNTSSDNKTTNEIAEIVNVKVVNITENSVEFVVQTKGDPDSFYIRYKEKLDKEEVSYQIKKGEKVIVKDLVPSGRYEFRFQIEPPFRADNTTTPFYVTLLPGVPDVIFRNINDGFVDVEWFRSIDDFYRNTTEEYELSYNSIRQIGGKTWQASDCVITIKIPNRNSCTTSRYTIAGLEKKIYYEIRLRLRTSTGFGKPYVNKVYTL